MRNAVLVALASLLGVLLSATLAWADPARFFGEYAGSAEITFADGTTEPRDMSVTISETKDGYSVQWSSVSYRKDGRKKEKTYQIDFIPAGRGDVYAAAMKRNVFGHAEQLDPMKGEPYVWSRIEGDMLTVFSLYVREDGGYELQQFDRTLADGGLDLNFQRFSNGVKERGVETFLERQ